MISFSLVLFFLVVIAGFYMAWNIGANDVANAMGTSVGSGALTLLKAVIIAGILEFLGAFLLGSNVSETVQQGIVNPELFIGKPKILFTGMLAALVSTALWLQIASYFGWPVSTTHAIVGSIIGFGALIGGVHTVHWLEVGSIAASWVASPVLSGVISFAIFKLLQRQILYAPHPVLAAKKFIPFLTGAVFFVFTLSVLANGLGSFQVSLKAPAILGIGFVFGFFSFVVSRLIIQRKKIEPESTIISPNTTQHVVALGKAHKHLQRIKLSATGDHREKIASLLREIRDISEALKKDSGYYTKSNDYYKVEKLFASLQVLSACYVAFAHGANDVANAIGPVSAALEVLQKGRIELTETTPLWLLALGGAGIVVGLATWGWRVMETIGKKITELTPTRGFTAEFGAAVTILVASKCGIPVSTTHCIVGSVLGVGIARGISALNLMTVRNIILSWVITLPSSAFFCIFVYYVLRAVL